MLLKKKAIIMGLMSLCLVGWMVTSQTNHAQAESKKILSYTPSTVNKMSQFSTWLWDTSWINNPDSLLSNLETKQVNKLYLQIDPSIPFSTYETFIGKATAAGIQVFALDGSPDWVTPSNTGKNAFINWVSAYQAGAAPDQQFRGLHADVEPYLNQEWGTNCALAVKWYQDTVTYLNRQAKQLSVPLELDVPFWFDGQTYSNSTYGQGTLSDWVTRNTDSITIMAYRNTATGSNGINALVSHEISYASNVGKSVTVGVETQNLPDTPTLTFYGSGQAVMMDVLSQVASTYQTSPSFSGFAIHSFESWMQLGS